MRSSSLELSFNLLAALLGAENQTDGPLSGSRDPVLLAKGAMEQKTGLSGV
jgi:hypothetical protein